MLEPKIVTCDMPLILSSQVVLSIGIQEGL